MQKLHSYIRTLIKAPPPFASDMFTYQTTTALLTCSKFAQTRLFPSFPAFCCVHFLTFVSNSSIFQRPSTARTPFPLFPVRVDTFRGFRFVCFFPFLVSGCKVITFIPHTQIFCVKKY